VRSLVHRIAAVVFIAVTLTHAISLAANRRLRRHWMELIPTAQDGREALANFSYNVGLRSAPPGRSAHSYIEKAEYWAVVWGAMVMIATGLMLWGNNLMLALFPKLWLDVATSVHFYEALLATLAIVVWHFYTVIFDPDVYPMDTAWLTGVSVKEPEPHAARQAREENDPTGMGAGRETISK
jgi:cytochrome b subunit of formate dehydrogenase